VDVDPDNADARLKLAQIFFLSEKIDEAEKHVKVLLSKNPSNVDALLLKGALLLNQEKLDDAISVFRKAEDQGPDNSKVYMALARAYSQKKDQNQVELFLKKAISVSKKGKDQSQSRLAPSSLYESTGQEKKAEEEIKIIIGENPDEVNALLIMASVMSSL
jgi:tetratricopeptide (TPR) repeat protein